MPGKSIITADGLPWAPNNWFTEKDSNVFQDAELQVNMMMSKIQNVWLRLKNPGKGWDLYERKTTMQRRLEYTS